MVINLKILMDKKIKFILSLFYKKMYQIKFSKSLFLILSIQPTQPRSEYTYLSTYIRFIIVILKAVNLKYIRMEKFNRDSTNYILFITIYKI